MTVEVQFAGLSDIGRNRAENQDHWFADPKVGLFLVADGMGGGFEGGLAAQVVVKTLPLLIANRRSSLRDLRRTSVAKVFKQILVDLSQHVRRESSGQPGLEGMGSTVVAALVRGRRALIGHLGDSRAYHLRTKQLSQLTTDHTVIQLLLDSGDLRPEEVVAHPARGQVTQFVGMEGEPLPGIRRVDLQPEDKLLLCSDGLTGMVSDSDLASTLSLNVSPPIICRQLIDAANEAGGEDNITSVVLELIGQ